MCVPFMKARLPGQAAIAINCHENLASDQDSITTTAWVCTEGSATLT
jgi:hypothetical protein